MEVLRLNGENVDACAGRAAFALRAGGVVLYPTDTLYALGADALSDEAVENVFAVKRRDKRKPVHAIVSDISMAAAYGEISDAARRIVEAFGGAVTLVVKKRNGFDSGILRGISTFGFRVPGNEFCIALVREFCGPITATSANASGAPPARRVEDVLSQFGTGARKIDLVIDAGELPEREPSSVVDMTASAPRVLRAAAVSAAEIEKILKR